MRPTLLIFVLSGILFVGGATTHAQPPHAADGLEARVQALVTRLALTPAQTNEVRAILVEARRTLVRMRFEARARDETPDAREARQRVLWDAEDRIWALLSCTQKDAYRLMERERRAAMLDRLAEEGLAGPRERPRRPRR